MAEELIAAAYFILPAYAANGAPVLFGGGRPIDGGRNFRDGRPIFGSHKTIRGLLGGVVCGVIVGLLLEIFFGQGLLVVGSLIAVGAVAGDLAGAFLKRRLGFKPGSLLPVVDQLDFVAGGLAVSLWFYPMSLFSILLVIVLTPPIHVLTNVGAYLLGLKKNYW